MKVTLPRLGFGAANLGNLGRAMTDADARSILDVAWEAGIRHFDTAPHYGLGLSERRLGEWLSTKPRSSYVVSTKVGRLLRPNPGGGTGLDQQGFVVPDTLRRTWDFTADGVRRSLDGSLERLGLDRVDVVYLHDPEAHDIDLALDEALPALAALRGNGTVDVVGVGSMSADALAAVAESAEVDVLMVAGRLTLADGSALGRVVPACVDRGISIVAASVFNSGLLARDRPADDAHFDYAPADAALITRVRAIADRCAAHDVRLPAAALQYPFRVGAVSSVVIAGSRPEQVAENARLATQDIPEALWADLVDAGLLPAHTFAG